MPLATALLGPPANPKYDNYVDASVALGGKSNVASGCVVGRGTVLGDKCSVKRSVIGANCKLGTSVKVGAPQLLARPCCMVLTPFPVQGCEAYHDHFACHGGPQPVSACKFRSRRV